MKTLPQPSYTGDLPIHEQREAIISAIRANQVIVIAGETGSGKTTQIPKFLLDCGFGRKGWIGCTQPRRVAALSVAQRIAEELKVPYGGPVGSKIRFTDATREDTSIKLMTDGILLNELQDDPLLRGYEAIVIDEAHERSLNIDFILGCLCHLTSRRKDLKIVITSATIDTESFSKAFDNAPIIEVSGRMYPVETHYRPIEELAADNRDFDYIDGAATVVHEILGDMHGGDLLIFLPGERDIHELRRILEDSSAGNCDILPLFGRLSNADQQRIFKPSGRRRIILSTNIAETSLTVPGIRYVIDSGLARISRYSSHSRTQRLPIEPIAQSSAEQRKGRCGRVSNGICFRLYSEEDYLTREIYSTPEIHRSNLASVILRMMAFKLGDIRSFPFIDPPSESAIVGGYRLLAELGALQISDEGQRGKNYRLTPLGRRLARLPVDPTIGRMLLQAQKENVLDDMLVIASGLSIQDPRERPADFADEADAVHQQFGHAESDFLTLLNIWNAYHEQLDTLSENKLRKFCRQQFLAYQRMREWRDIHHQIHRLMQEGKSRSKKQTEASLKKRAKTEEVDYASIHRSILAGLLSNVAHKEEAHYYRGPRNRKAMLFPGSGLFDREAAKKQRKAAYAKKTKPKPAVTNAPEWIVCGEWMETSQLFARTAAKVEVEWIEEVAGDLISVRHSEPFWSDHRAAALCKERKLLFGLELSRSNVSCSRIDPEEATNIFVRKGLIEGGIEESPSFVLENQRVREAAESEMARLQIGSAGAVEDRLFDFYWQRLSAVGSYAELRSFSKKYHGGSLDFLRAKLSDLIPEKDESDEDAFPRSIELGGQRIDLQYRNEPGHEADGVTLRVNLTQFNAIRQSGLDWAVPGHLEEKIESLLRSLPKDLRVKLHPLKERAAEIRQELKASDQPLSLQLAEQLKAAYNVQVYRDQWDLNKIPERLRPRIQVVDTMGNLLSVSRDLDTIESELKAKAATIRRGKGIDSVPAWRDAAAKFEREDLSDWTIGNLPERIDLSGQTGVPLSAYPCLLVEGEGIHLRLSSTYEEARRSTFKAWPRLCELAMGRHAAWTQRDLSVLQSLGTHLLPLGGFDSVKGQAWDHLRRHLFRCSETLPLKKVKFQKVMARAERERRGIAHKLHDRLQLLMEARAEVALLLEQKKSNRAITYPGMRAQLEAIAPANLLEKFEFDELPHLARFLRGMMIRATRARENIQKDLDKAARIQSFEEKLHRLAEKAAQKQQLTAIKPYRLLLEEFKVSVFAQELGTSQKVSEKRLEQLYAAIEASLR